MTTPTEDELHFTQRELAEAKALLSECEKALEDVLAGGARVNDWNARAAALLAKLKERTK